MRQIYHIGISGGKDSTALLLWAVRESGIPHPQIVASFCDTQNEAACTYEHIWKLNREVFPVTWLESEGFFNLAKRKKRFPSTKARFCTQELKLKPTKAFLESLSDCCDEVIAVSGVRRGESLARAKLSEWGDPMESYFGLKEWRPLIEWTLRDVLAIHERHGISLNPLYSKGAQRVGCFPCVMSNKSEMRAMTQNAPERIDQLREWENEIGSTFFPPNAVPPRFRSREWVSKDGSRKKKICTIDDVVMWAKSGWRAQGWAPDVDGLFDEQLKDLSPEICLAQHLACE